jgi:hypothetical protein
LARDGAARRLAKQGRENASGLLKASRLFGGAGWSSPVARQAHNLKVVGSNPAPATSQNSSPEWGFYFVLNLRIINALANTQSREAENMAITRRATCRCGQLTAVCTGPPVRVSVCHCHDCQRRSGSAFAFQARFSAGNVAISGDERVWEATADSGNVMGFHFCPVCGSTVYFQGTLMADLVAIPIGAFADNSFPPPEYSVYEGRKHAWIDIVGLDIEHFD